MASEDVKALTEGLRRCDTGIDDWVRASDVEALLEGVLAVADSLDGGERYVREFVEAVKARQKRTK